MLVVFWIVLSAIVFGITYSDDTRKPTDPEYHPINNENPYSDRVGLKPGVKVDPVIFEPLRNVKLSRSTFKVTSFIDFSDTVQSFYVFEDFLNRFIADMLDPDLRATMYRMSMPSDNEGPCVDCYGKDQITGVIEELRDLEKVFDHLKRRFFTAIDHIERTGQNRTKRETEKGPRTTHAQYNDLNQEEKQWLETLLIKIKDLDTTSNETLEREKRFSFESWILGWGVWSNARNIKKIKKNLKILYEQNVLQDKQIKELATYLNLTAVQVRANTKAMYELDDRIIRMDHILQQLTKRLSETIYYTYFMLNVQHRVNKLTAGLFMLAGDVEKIYEYLRVLSTHRVNPLVLPPESFRKTLKMVDEQMRSNPRLELPHNPETDIWAYYSIVRVTPVVFDDLLVIVLTIPLLDTSLKMDLYRVHNLPAVHPELELQAKYELEGEYFAVGQHGLYVALPTATDIQLCLSSGGGLCVMNQALYPREKVDWCIYALFIKDDAKIKENCLVQARPKITNLAQSLGGYLWAVSSLAGDTLQIRCIKETNVQKINPPLQIIHVGNGCEGYSASISIPAKSELTSEEDYKERTDYFMGFNANYTKIRQYGAWIHLKLEEMPEAKRKQLAMKLSELPPMTFEHLNKKLPEMDQEYPWSVSSNMVLFLLIGSLVVWLVMFGLCLWRMYKMKVGFKAMKPLGRIIRGKPGEGDVSKIKEVISDILALNTPPQPAPRPAASLPAVPPEPTRSSRLPAIELPTIVPQNANRVGSTPSGTRQARTTTATIHQTASPTTSATTVLFDLLQDERQARRYGKFLDRKAAEHAEEYREGGITSTN